MKRLPVLAVLLWLTSLAAPHARAAEPEPKPADKPARYEVRKEHDPDGIGKFYMGREIAQVMGHLAAGWLDRPEREKEEAPTKLMETLKLQPGDAVAVYCGRDQWQAANPETPYGRPFGGGPNVRPGLHVSCLPFLRDHDVSLLVWDMLDHLPIGYDIPWAVHAALFAYGVALLDNALLEPLAQACVEEGRDEFMLVIAPLRVVGGTGSPANPLAVF